MTKHVILWQLKDELSAEQKAEVKKQIKAGLEGLVGKVPGLLEVHVHIDGLASSNADLMLDTTLESPEALKGYAVHPAHLAVANGVVRPNTKNRECFDIEIRGLMVSRQARGRQPQTEPTGMGAAESCGTGHHLSSPLVSERSAQWQNIN